MGIRIVDLDGGCGSQILATGTLNGPEYLETMKAHLRQPPEKIGAYLYSLVDYSEVEAVEFGSAEVRYVADMSRKARRLNHQVIVALVSQSALIYGLLRMWQLFLADDCWESRIFEDFEEAKRWLRIRGKEKFGAPEFRFHSEGSQEAAGGLVR